MMNREDDNMLIVIESWDDLVKSILGTFTTSYRTICDVLKCDRSWANRYIKHNVHHVFISNKNLQILNMQCGVNLKDNLYFHTKEFESFIKKNLMDCSRQTINIPYEWLIEETHIDTFRNHYKELKNSYEKETITYPDFIDEVNHMINQYGTNAGKILNADKPLITKRPDSTHYPCDKPKFNLEDLIAPHDLRDYGTTTEMIYRKLFSEGVYRVVLKILDKNNNESNKIYYIKNDSEVCGENTVDYILVKYELYKKYIAKYHKKKI